MPRAIAPTGPTAPHDGVMATRPAMAPEAPPSIGAIYVKPEVGEHDALVDIQNSIDELAHYRSTLFRTP
jgi:oligoribonuclease (3'-5' exoribonuclease)